MQWKKLNLLLSIIFYANFGFAQAGLNFFSFNNVHQLNINFQIPNYIDSLTYYKSVDDATGLETYLHAQVIIDTDTIQDVGIRFRGNASYGHPGTKKPLQLDFNEFVSGQEYDNLKKLNLNNSYLDPTQIREKLCLDIFNQLDLPAPRCAYAAVYYNSTYVGLYKAVETINNDFLKTFFDNDTGNLYKCEPDMPLTWEGNDQTLYYDNCELRSNETLNDWTNLLNFLDQINNNTVDNFENAVRPIFNLDDYIKSWASNMVMGNLDSYLYLPHNYYLYENPATLKMEWITWDVSLAFGVYALLVVPNSENFDIEYLPNNPETARPLNYYCLKNNNLEKQYLTEICAFMQNYFSPAVIYSKIDSIANVIRPYIQLEPSSNQMFTNQEFESNLSTTTVNYQLLGQIPGLKSFISSRIANIKKQLCKLNWNCGIGDFIENSNAIDIYPNPGSVINIKYNVPAESSYQKFTVKDFMGRTVMNSKINNSGGNIHSVDLSHLDAGVYFFETTLGCEPSLNKIVVVK